LFAFPLDLHADSVPIFFARNPGAESRRALVQVSKNFGRATWIRRRFLEQVSSDSTPESRANLLTPLRLRING